MLRACRRRLGAPRRPTGADYPIVKSPVSFAATGQAMVLGQMQRRQFITLLGGAAAWPLAARAQQPARLPTVGYMGSATPATQGQWAAVFAQRLQELGWTEGRNVTIEVRWAEGRSERFAEIAAEFVALKVDVIVTSGGVVPTVKQATSVIPVV